VWSAVLKRKGECVSVCRVSSFGLWALCRVLLRAVGAVQRCGRRAVACVRTDHQGLEKRHDEQAACEPGV
jgi:hypothetical protein